MSNFDQIKDKKLERFGYAKKPDKQIYNCIEPGCQNKIIFGPRDIEYYAKRGWVNPDGSIQKPKRCAKHRAERRKKREEQNDSMNSLLREADKHER